MQNARERSFVVNMDDMFKKPVVYRTANMDDSIVVQDIIYKEVNNQRLTMDAYYPPEYNRESPLPAVLFIHGDAAWEHLKSIKESGQYTSWGKLAAASGLIGITFTHRSTEGFADFANPTEDILDLFAYVQKHAEELFVNPDQIAVWVCSAGGPTGLTAVLRSKPQWVKCLVSYYALMDLNGLEDHFSNQPDMVSEYSARTHLKESPSKIPPMLVVKAELDRPHFNDSIDRFADEAKRLGVQLKLMYHPTGHHGFDLFDDNETSREIIKETLSFFRKHLK
jgi:acetyl esterase/lipase